MEINNLLIMAEKENILLTDILVYPSDEIIFAIIGEKKMLWKAIMKYMSDNYAGSSGEWRFYNDGKRWLFKMVYKKKTVFWATIMDRAFKITFYMGNKAENIINNSELSAEIKEDFKTAKRYGLIRPLSFIIKQQNDFENVLKIIAIKIALK